MKVRVRWTEEVDRESVIDIDEAKYLEWLEGTEDTERSLTGFVDEETRDDSGYTIEALYAYEVKDKSEWADVTVHAAEYLTDGGGTDG